MGGYSSIMGNVFYKNGEAGMNRRMTKRRRRFWMIDNNRGNTLIEVIVCVLIIGIAFVPLMVGLNASLRINKETENKLYAENVASNIVEICKTYGEQGLSTLKTLNSDTSKGIKAFLAGDSVKLEQNGTDPEFFISAISAGVEDKNYYAEIKFEDGDYATQQNDFSAYQSISGLSDAVIVAFENETVETIVSKFFAISSAQGSTVTEAELRDKVSEWLKRQITIDVKTVTVDEKTRYVVEKKIEYTAANVSVNGKKIFGGEINSVVYQSQPFEKRTIYWTSGTTQEDVIGTQPVEESYRVIPKSVIITYSQLKNAASNTYVKTGSPTTDPYDLVVNMGVSGGSIGVYALCTDVAALNMSDYSLHVCGKGNYSNADSSFTISAYSNLNPYDPTNPTSQSHNYTNCNMLTHFGDGSTGKQSKMKDVSVTVREKDASGRILVEKTSTIIEFE